MNKVFGQAIDTVKLGCKTDLCALVMSFTNLKTVLKTIDKPSWIKSVVVALLTSLRVCLIVKYFFR